MDPNTPTRGVIELHTKRRAAFVVTNQIAVMADLEGKSFSHLFIRNAYMNSVLGTVLLGLPYKSNYSSDYLSKAT